MGRPISRVDDQVGPLAFADALEDERQQRRVGVAWAVQERNDVALVTKLPATEVGGWGYSGDANASCSPSLQGTLPRDSG
jgi:hypothetical protein